MEPKTDDLVTDAPIDLALRLMQRHDQRLKESVNVTHQLGHFEIDDSKHVREAENNANLAEVVSMLREAAENGARQHRFSNRIIVGTLVVAAVGVLLGIVSLFR